jgi:hypothetical protein
LVTEAERALAAGEARRARALYGEADREYMAVLGELRRLSEREAKRIELLFTKLEVRLQRLMMRVCEEFTHSSRIEHTLPF